MGRRQIFLSIGFGFIGAMLYSAARDLVPAAQAGQTQIITASGFNLVDQAGKLRAQIGFAKEGPPGIWFLDDKGVARIIGGLYSDNTPYFGLQDRNGEMIELMRAFGPKQTPLLIFKMNGQDMMISGLNPTSNPVPFLMSYDSARKKTIQFGKYDGP